MVIRALAVGILLIAGPNWTRFIGMDEPVMHAALGVTLGLAACTFASIAVALRARPRWIWVVIVLAGLVQTVEAVWPPAQAGSEWEFVGPIVWLVARVVTFLAALVALVVTYTEPNNPRARH